MPETLKICPKREKLACTMIVVACDEAVDTVQCMYCGNGEQRVCSVMVHKAAQTA